MAQRWAISSPVVGAGMNGDALSNEPADAGDKLRAANGFQLIDHCFAVGRSHTIDVDQGRYALWSQLSDARDDHAGVGVTHYG